MQVRRHIEPAGYVLVALALWPVPLLNRLHAESSAVLALAAWGLAGWAAIRAFRDGAGFGPVLRRRLAMLTLPLALMTVPVLWAPNCDWPHGLLLFALFPGVTAVLAVAAAWALTGAGVRRPLGALLAIGLALAVLGPLYDVGFHPQFYTYNHVFGGVLGPLYDEEIVWRAGLFAFRGLTLLWAALAWSFGAVLRAAPGSRVRRRGLACAAAATLLIGAAYVGSGRLGFNTRERDLARALPVESVVGNMTLHLDPAIEPERRRRIESESAYRYDRLARVLEIEPERRVEVWVYPDAETRGRLIGARVTSIAPVWLATPQVHVLERQFERVFAHELVHAFSRGFGMPVLNASPSVGLVEGLAVALEPPGGEPGPDEQVAAVRTDLTADRLAESLSPWGFWGGRGAVSYTTTGSFVRYLCDAYGVEAVKDVYASAGFGRVFGRSPRELADGWMEALDRLEWLPVDASRRARSRFAVPSLFERRCPHHVPATLRHRRASERAWERRDTLSALRAAQRALAAAPRDPAAIAIALRMHLRAGDDDAARRLLIETPDSLLTATGAVVAADLMAIDGRAEEARERYDQVRLSLPASSREARAVLTLRRLLAGRPDALRLLVLGGLVRDPAGALARLRRQDPDAASQAALGMTEALVRADHREFEDAVRILETVRPAGALAAGDSAWREVSAGERNALALQRFAWLAELGEAAGDLGASAAYADSAAGHSGALGDLSAERYWTDQAGRLRQPRESFHRPAPTP
jgi:hypothetical protein